MMDEARFWKLIADSRSRVTGELRDGGQFFDRQCEELTKLLETLSPAEIMAFQERFDHSRDLAYRWDLWGAAYWLLGGCSDDGFIDFRSCLISLGQKDFFHILEDPDRVAELVDRTDVPYMMTEGFQYLTAQVYESKTGKGIWEAMPSRSAPAEPSGKEWDFDDEEAMRQHFPRLTARLPEGGE